MFILDTTNKYTTKDQLKANYATAYIGIPDNAKSSTYKYLMDAVAQRIPTNEDIDMDKENSP